MLPRLHLLVSERELSTPGGMSTIGRILERAAPCAVHLRGNWSTRDLHALAVAVEALTERAGGWLVVNGRPDVALAAGAHAVQLGRTALSVRDVRGLVEARGGALEIGASVHDAEEAARAVRAGADYLVLGTIYPTASHPGVEGSGPAGVRAVREQVSAPFDRPVLAIGGVSRDRVAELSEAGAHGVVVGRAIWDAPDPIAAAEALTRELELRAGNERGE